MSGNISKDRGVANVFGDIDTSFSMYYNTKSSSKSYFMLQMQFKHFKQQFNILDNAHVIYLRTHGDYYHTMHKKCSTMKSNIDESI